MESICLKMTLKEGVYVICSPEIPKMKFAREIFRKKKTAHVTYT